MVRAVRRERRTQCLTSRNSITNSGISPPIPIFAPLDIPSDFNLGLLPRAVESAVVDSVELALRNTELVALRTGKRNGAGHWVDGGIVSRARLGEVGGVGCELFCSRVILCSVLVHTDSSDLVPVCRRERRPRDSRLGGLACLQR